MIENAAIVYISLYEFSNKEIDIGKGVLSCRNTSWSMENETNRDPYLRYFELRPSSSINESVRPSVCLSVCLSVRHTFSTMFPSSYHHEIFRSYHQWQKWCPCKSQGRRSRSQRSQLNRFWTVTPVWIHIWWSNDAYSLMLLRRGAPLFFKVICQISGSPGSKNRRIWPRSGVSEL